MDDLAEALRKTIKSPAAPDYAGALRATLKQPSGRPIPSPGPVGGVPPSRASTEGGASRLVPGLDERFTPQPQAVPGKPGAGIGELAGRLAPIRREPRDAITDFYREMVKGKNAPGRVLGAMGTDLPRIWGGQGPLGMTPETASEWGRMGIFNAPGRPWSPIKALNESLMRPGAAGLDFANRVLQSGFSAGIEGVEQIGREFGYPGIGREMG